MSLLEDFRVARYGWNARRASRVAPCEVRPGLVAILGRVEPIEEPEPSLFTGRPSVLWSVTVEEPQVDDGLATGRWMPKLFASSGRIFALVDDRGGRVVVEPVRVRDFLRLIDVSAHPGVNYENARLAELFVRHGVSPTAFMGLTGEHRFCERAVAPGDAIAVYGRVERRPAVRSDGYRDAPEEILFLTGGEGEPLVVMER